MHTRMYLLLALCIWVFAGDAASAQAPFRLSPANKQYSVFTSNSELSYRINMSGALDEFNTSNYRANYGAHRAIFSGFQPNKYLMIENQGTTNVTNPQITVNGRRNWNSAESIVASVASPTMTQAEKAMAIFNHVSAYDTSCHDNNRRVGPELPENPKDLKQGQFKELADPVKAANAYYCSGCSLLSSNMVLLAQKAGIQGRVVWVSPSETYRNHAVAELYYDNDWHVFDPDRRAFYLEKDNKTIASYKDLHERPELVARTHLGGFASKGVGPSLAREFGMYGSPKEMPVDPSWSSNMNMTLRPGERFLWRWDSDDKYRVGNNPRNPGLSPPQLANGKIIYQPRLEPSLRASSEVSEANLNTAVGAQGAIRLTPKAVGVDSQLTYRVDSPYPIVGGLIGARVQRSSLENAAQLQISRDGTTWVSAWSASHVGETQAYASIDGLLNAKHSEPIYSYYVRFTGKQSHLNSTLSISDLYVETDVQMARTSLPSLSVGLNEIVYKDQTKAKTGSKVKISHGWQESWATLPPNAPATSVSPAVGETVTSAGQLYLNWQAASDPRGDSIVGYHVQVSDRQDMMYALSPSLDRMTYNSSTSWQIPDGWLTPGQRYYWHVRALDSWGAWSPWSSTWHFQVSTPPASRPVAALAIPEPSTGLLLLVGLVGSAQMFRRQTISN